VALSSPSPFFDVDVLIVKEHLKGLKEIDGESTSRGVALYGSDVDT